MDQPGGYTTVESSDGFTVSSTMETPESMNAALAIEPAVESPSDDAPPAPVADDRNDDGTFKAKAKPRHDPKARVEQATATAAEAKREREAATKERDDARAESARYKAELEALKAPKVQTAAPVVASATPEPDPTDATKYPDGHFDRQYLKDQARWEARQEIAAEREKERAAQQQSEAQRHQQQRTADWTAKLAKARVEVPDFDSRVKADTPLDPQIHPYLMAQDDGPLLLLYLSEHPDVAQRLVTLHPIAQIGELGKISARLEAASSRGPVSTVIPSKAAAPIKPLVGGHVPATDDADDSESFEAHFARENSKERRAGR